MNRAIREGESREQYKANMKHEQEAADRAINGTYIWNGQQVSGSLKHDQGTAIRNPKSHLEGQPHYKRARV